MNDNQERYDADADACKVIVWIVISALVVIGVVVLCVLRGCR